MADVKVCNLPDRVVASIRARGNTRGAAWKRSCASSLPMRRKKGRQETIRQLKAFRNKLRKKHGVLTIALRASAKTVKPADDGCRRERRREVAGP